MSTIAATSLMLTSSLAKLVSPWLTWSGLASLFFTLVALAATYVVYRIFIYFPYLSALRGIPGPPADHWLSGNIPEIQRRMAADPQLDWSSKYGPFVRYRFFLGERLLISDPEAIRHVLVTHAQKYNRPPIATSLLARVIGYGLLTSEGEDHVRMRKLINPAFHFANIKGFVAMFNECANVLAAKWGKAVENLEANNQEQIKESQEEARDMSRKDKDKDKDKDTAKPIRVPSGAALVNIHVDLTKLTMDVIGRAAFGYDFHAQANEDREMFDMFSALMAVGKLSWKLLVPLVRYIPLPENLAFNRALKSVNGLVETVISEKKAKPLNLETPDLLDLLLAIRDEDTGAGISDQELRDQVKTFMLAGHETTSVGMSWMLYALAMHPDIQVRLRRELADFDFDNVSLDKLDKLPFLNAFVQETLRLYPPVPITNRLAIEDDEIGGIFVPKGTIVMMCPGALHRLESVWKNPTEFQPERFLSEAEGGTGEFAKINRMHYLPFLHGSRMCIGHRFATVEMKAVISVLVHKFEFFMPENAPPVVKKLTVTMRPFPDLRLGVKPASEESY